MPHVLDKSELKIEITGTTITKDDDTFKAVADKKSFKLIINIDEFLVNDHVELFLHEETHEKILNEVSATVDAILMLTNDYFRINKEKVRL